MFAHGSRIRFLGLPSIRYPASHMPTRSVSHSASRCLLTLVDTTRWALHPSGTALLTCRLVPSSASSSPSIYLHYMYPSIGSKKRIIGVGVCMTTSNPSDTMLHICRLVLSAAQSLLICTPSVYVSSMGAKKGDRRDG